MPLNPYFTPYHETDGNTNEQDLYNSMIRESIEMMGQEYVYIPRTMNKFDQLFGEDVLSSFETHANFVAWCENYNGFGGESELLAKFGMEIRDSMSLIIHRQEFTERIEPIVPASRHVELKWRPNEGDLIYVPFSKSLFEIRFVEDEAPGFYQLKKKYVWTLRCELVQLNSEKFTTGSTEIDDVFGINLNRIDTCIVQEDGDVFVCEEGGFILLEEYEVSKPVNDIIGYGDDNAIKSEFMQIMDFDESNPFGE